MVESCRSFSTNTSTRLLGVVQLVTCKVIFAWWNDSNWIKLQQSIFAMPGCRYTRCSRGILSLVISGFIAIITQWFLNNRREGYTIQPKTLFRRRNHFNLWLALPSFWASISNMLNGRYQVHIGCNPIHRIAVQRPTTAGHMHTTGILNLFSKPSEPSLLCELWLVHHCRSMRASFSSSRVDRPGGKDKGPWLVGIRRRNPSEAATVARSEPGKRCLTRQKASPCRGAVVLL